MNPIDIMKRNASYGSGYRNFPSEKQMKAKRLCWQYNRTSPDEQVKRREILQQLFGTCSPMTFIEPSFRCDYGFNIHTHGLTVINYNCVILDTSPVNIGAGAFIAPGVCLACSGHAIDAHQRSNGIGTSAPITIGDNVWIGANSVVCGGVDWCRFSNRGGKRRYKGYTVRCGSCGSALQGNSSCYGRRQNKSG